MATKPGNRWSAVSITCTSGSCGAAQALKGRRYLGVDAPRLPLLNCTSPEICPCVYHKHIDRRAGPRRESESGSLRRQSANPERRRGRGRRSTD